MRLAFFLLGLWVGKAMACGYCVEDRIAAVYDHAAVAQAAAQKQTVAYFAIDGAIRDTKARLESLLGATKGIRKGSLRVSVESASLAVVFDPRRVSLAAVQRALEQKLRPLGLTLLFLDTK